MTRSFKKRAVYTLTNQIDKDLAHKKVRKFIRQELAKPEPDECKIEFDTRDLNEEEWGTKFDVTGMDCEDKAKRK